MSRAWWRVKARTLAISINKRSAKFENDVRASAAQCCGCGVQWVGVVTRDLSENVWDYETWCTRCPLPDGLVLRIDVPAGASWSEVDAAVCTRPDWTHTPRPVGTSGAARFDRGPSAVLVQVVVDASRVLDDPDATREAALEVLEQIRQHAAIAAVVCP